MHLISSLRSWRPHPDRPISVFEPFVLILIVTPIIITIASTFAELALFRWQTVTPQQIDISFGNGVLIIGEIYNIKMDDQVIQTNWRLEGNGPGYRMEPLWHLDMAVDVYFDGALVTSYDPSKIIKGRDGKVYSAQAARFIADLKLGGDLWSGFWSTTDVVVLNPATNDTVLVSNIQCFLPPDIPWTLNSTTWINNTPPPINSTSPTAPSLMYALTIDMAPRNWKKGYDALIGVAAWASAFASFMSTWRTLKLSRSGKRPSLVDSATVPFVTGGVIATMRGSVPPVLGLERLMDLTVYYPTLIITVWCGVGSAVLTSNRRDALSDYPLEDVERSQQKKPDI